MTDAAHVVNATVGRHVRRAISESGSNLRAVAERAGLSYRSVLRYISGERDMPVPVLLALVAASDADLGELMRDLEAELRPNQPPRGPQPGLRHQPHQQTGVSASDEPGLSLGEVTTALQRAQLRLDEQMRAIGVNHLAARSIGTVDADELAAIADIVQEIVQELRDS